MYFLQDVLGTDGRAGKATVGFLQARRYGRGVVRKSNRKKGAAMDRLTAGLPLSTSGQYLFFSSSMNTLVSHRSIEAPATLLRSTALPVTREEIHAWMWRVVTRGKVPSLAETGDRLGELALTLRSAGNGDAAPGPLTEDQRAMAKEYAETLGWEITQVEEDSLVS